MSTPTIEDRIRSLRSRILREMLRLPWAFAEAVAPETPQLGSIYGRSLLAPYQREMKVCISPSSDSCPDTIKARVYTAPSYSDFDVFEYLNKVQMDSKIYTIPYRYEIIGGGAYYRALEPSDVKVLVVRPVDVAAVKEFAYPPDYPPSQWPPELKLWGAIREDSPEEGCTVYQVDGMVGYDSNGRLIYWSASALVVDGYCEAVIRLHWGAVGKFENTWTGALIVGEVISAVFGMVTVEVLR